MTQWTIADGMAAAEDSARRFPAQRFVVVIASKGVQVRPTTNIGGHPVVAEVRDGVAVATVPAPASGWTGDTAADRLAAMHWLGMVRA